MRCLYTQKSTFQLVLTTDSQRYVILLHYGKLDHTGTVNISYRHVSQISSVVFSEIRKSHQFSDLICRHVPLYVFSDFMALYNSICIAP